MLQWVLAVAIALVTMGICGAVSFGVGSLECQSRASTMGRPWQYTLLGGCFIDVGGRWVPLAQVRVSP